MTTKPAKTAKTKRWKAIQIWPDARLHKEIARMAEAENRKLGPMVLEIVRRFLRSQTPPGG